MKTALLLAAMALSTHAYAGPFDHDHGSDDAEAAGLQVSGVADFRAVRTSMRRTFLYNSFFYQGAAIPAGGENKLRYGGKDINADQVGERRSTELVVPQISLLFDAEVM